MLRELTSPAIGHRPFLVQRKRHWAACLHCKLIWNLSSWRTKLRTTTDSERPEVKKANWKLSRSKLKKKLLTLNYLLDITRHVLTDRRPLASRSSCIKLGYKVWVLISGFDGVVRTSKCSLLIWWRCVKTGSNFLWYNVR